MTPSSHFDVVMGERPRDPYDIAMAHGGWVAGMFEGRFTFEFPSEEARLAFRRESEAAGAQTVPVNPASGLGSWLMCHDIALGRALDAADYHEGVAVNEHGLEIPS